MAYPLIILGAGASFDFRLKEKSDSIDNLDYLGPPLNNNLFDARFQKFRDRYKPLLPEITSYIRNILCRNNISIENILANIRNNKIKFNAEISKQLIAMLFYLADLFSSVTREYYISENNYNDLLFQIKTYGKHACFVNFNYDLLLERSLWSDQEYRGQVFEGSINDYITGPIKVIKIHGACNWFCGRRVKGQDKKGSYEYALIDSQFLLKNEGNNYNIVINNPSFSKDLSFSGNEPDIEVYHPAIAIPMPKKSRYICPNAHIEVLKNEIKKIDRIIIIGWKGADNLLLNILKKDVISKKIPIAIVCGKQSKNLILQNLGKLSESVKIIDQNGFSRFMQSGKCENFLKKTE